MGFDELRLAIGRGLLSFPVTDFRADGSFDAAGYASRIEWMSSFPASGLFAAGGTGEFFSLTPREYPQVVRTAVTMARRGVPILAGVGYGTALAVEMAQEARSAGAAGVLVLPHYLTEASDEGIARHVSAICAAVDIGVIYYARGNSRLKGDMVAKLAEQHANFIGYKDGIGSIQRLTETIAACGDRLVYIGGLPTAEVFAPAYLEMGATTYSSAAFNFAPEIALRFYAAVRARDGGTVAALMRSFFLPLTVLRDQRPGHAVSMIKRGVELIGRPAGPVRLPLIDLNAEETAILDGIIRNHKTAAAAAA